MRHLDALTFHSKVTYLVGDNGTGKSTLIEALAVAAGLNPEGGSRNFRFETRSSHSPLYQYLRLVRGVERPLDGYFLRAESYFNVASEIERLDREGGFGPPIIDGYGGKSLHEQSHGESFWALLNNRFQGHGLFFLDEPEAALSPARQLATLTRIHQLVLKKSQFIIATHSPILMAYPDAKIYVFSEDGIEETAYEDTDHYAITRDFLLRKDAMLRELLVDENGQFDLELDA